MSKAWDWWLGLLIQERKDSYMKYGFYFPDLVGKFTFDITPAEVERIYKFHNSSEKSRQLEFSRHEVLDRGALISDMIHSHILEHHLFKIHPELKEEGEQIASQFYNWICKVSVENDGSN